MFKSRWLLSRSNVKLQREIIITFLPNLHNIVEKAPSASSFFHGLSQYLSTVCLKNAIFIRFSTAELCTQMSRIDGGRVFLNFPGFKFVLFC